MEIHNWKGEQWSATGPVVLSVGLDTFRGGGQGSDVGSKSFREG